MASTTAHFIVGAALAMPVLTCRRPIAGLPNWTIPVIAGLLAAAPDLDLVGRRVPALRYSNLLSHRGLFHSPFFLILLAAALVGMAGIVARTDSRKTLISLWLLLAGCMVTHPLLDALTDGGAAVMLGFPLTRHRVFLPWHPIHSPPRGMNILNRAWFLRPSEIPFCVAAILIGISGLWILSRFGKPSAQQHEESPTVADLTRR